MSDPTENEAPEPERPEDEAPEPEPLPIQKIVVTIEQDICPDGRVQTVIRGAEDRLLTMMVLVEAQKVLIDWMHEKCEEEAKVQANSPPRLYVPPGFTPQGN